MVLHNKYLCTKLRFNLIFQYKSTSLKFNTPQIRVLVPDLYFSIFQHVLLQCVSPGRTISSRLVYHFTHRTNLN